MLQGLNPHQLHAVTAPFGNALVLAGAGSGKTRVLVSRMAYLIEQHQLAPEQLLAVTFTNKAAGEIKHRLRELLHISVHGLWVGTFHGLCHRLLRLHATDARLPLHFQIMDSDDQARVIKRVIAALQLDPEQWPVKQAQHFINAKKDEGLRPNQVAVQSYGPGRTWLAIYQAYEQACFSAGLVDFAEILLRCHDLLRNNPPLLAHYQQQFKAILVDEFQDTNTVQYAWIRLLAGPDTAVMVVGDDDQSIYGWRGAKIENIQRFSQDFTATDIIRLEQNYRSTANILNASNALITHNATRMGKELWTEGAAGEPIKVYAANNELDEARFIRERIQHAIDSGFSLDDIAILYRSNAQSRVLEEALLRAGIAYRIQGGMRFFERAEIKDVMAYLRLIMNPQDDTAFERIINFPTRGLGEKTLDEIRALAIREECSLWSAAEQVRAARLLPNRAANALAGFLALIQQLQADIDQKSVDQYVAHVITASGLEQHFAQLKGEQAQSKGDNLQELINAAYQFTQEMEQQEPAQALTAFLAHASLEGGEMQADEHERCVKLMTMHAAKGLEFPLVFLAGIEEGVFPSKLSLDEPGRIEEERRLCYVAMTRAKQQLVISHAQIRRQYGREEYHKPSRFLRELPSEYLQELTASVHAPRTTSTQHPSGLCLGQHVTHPHFGAGVILGFEGEGGHARVHVQFAGQGKKWLVLAYANLIS
jgi:DNA helicase-2/ATP-dependent DNA helicase PcrA